MLSWKHNPVLAYELHFLELICHLLGLGIQHVLLGQLGTLEQSSRGPLMNSPVLFSNLLVLLRRIPKRKQLLCKD